MRASVDILNPDRPKRIVIVASNPAVSGQTGWPIGLWWAELTHPVWEFTERGYVVDVARQPLGERHSSQTFSPGRTESKGD